MVVINISMVVKAISSSVLKYNNRNPYKHFNIKCFHPPYNTVQLYLELSKKPQTFITINKLRMLKMYRMSKHYQKSHVMY